MIRFENVTFAYERGKPVIQSASFVIHRGETVGLIGANGAGKSTVMKILLGLAGPGAGAPSQLFDGKILVDGLEVLPVNIARIRQKLGFVLQNSDNQMFMPTVLEDMLFGLLNSGMTRKEAEKKVDETLLSLGLLAMEPEVLLMDEPTSALDPYNRRVVIRSINSLPQTKIITSHDLDMIYDTCSRVILITGGKVAADGPAEQILKDEELLMANRMELPLRFQ